MKLERRTLKIFSVISIMVLAALALSACGSSAFASQVNEGKITICHANGGTGNPYDQITISFNELISHANHADDIIPAPAGGCPNTLQPGSNTGKITICHATNSASNPYTEITIDFNGLNGHSGHKDDIIPAPESGCPSVTATLAITTTLTVTTTSTTPTSTTTPTATAAGNADQKITICHATGSAKKPYVMITISINGLNGHSNHPRDIIPAPAGGCPSK